MDLTIPLYQGRCLLREAALLNPQAPYPGWGSLAAALGLSSPQGGTLGRPGAESSVQEPTGPTLLRL